MPKIIPLKLNENRPNWLDEFIDTLFEKHPGQQGIYVKSLMSIINEFEKNGAAINKYQKTLFLLRKLKGIDIVVFVNYEQRNIDT